MWATNLPVRRASARAETARCSLMDGFRLDGLDVMMFALLQRL